jgi:hypothetical protein
MYRHKRVRYDSEAYGSAINVFGLKLIGLVLRIQKDEEEDKGGAVRPVLIYVSGPDPLRYPTVLTLVIPANPLHVTIACDEHVTSVQSLHYPPR